MTTSNETPNPLPADRIAEAREIIAKATPGPWRPLTGMVAGRFQNICTTGDESYVAGPGRSDYGDPAADQAFIAAARTGWPEALDAAESAQARAAELERINQDLRDDWRSIAEAAGESWDIMRASLRGRIMDKLARAERAEKALERIEKIAWDTWAEYDPSQPGIVGTDADELMPRFLEIHKIADAASIAAAALNPKEMS